MPLGLRPEDELGRREPVNSEREQHVPNKQFDSKMYATIGRDIEGHAVQLADLLIQVDEEAFNLHLSRDLDSEKWNAFLREKVAPELKGGLEQIELLRIGISLLRSLERLGPDYGAYALSNDFERLAQTGEEIEKVRQELKEFSARWIWIRKPSYLGSTITLGILVMISAALFKRWQSAGKTGMPNEA